MRLLLVVIALSASACSLLIGFDGPAEQGAQCRDGVDNDGNGRWDCEEASCAPECGEACAAGVAADGRVDDPISGHCYLAFTTAREGFVADDACRQIGGYLAVPDDPAENALIRSIAPDSAALGLFNFGFGTAADFRLVTGDQPAQYLNFSAGQPDEFGDQAICVSYDGTASTWQDNPCTALRPYVCEVTPTPCGDRVVQLAETCDDGNQADGDGCASGCVDEDECTLGVANCSLDADCLNQPWQPGQPGFFCQCHEGFVGDGATCTPVPPTVVFEPLPGQPISGGLLGCTTAASPRGRKLAVDPVGVLYAAMLCPGGDAEVVVSIDGGASWSTPFQLRATGVAEIAVVSAAAGRVVVAMLTDAGDVTVRQSVDFGASWAPAQLVFTGAIPGFGVSVASDGFAVFVGFGAEVGASLRVHHSFDPDLATWPGLDTVSVTSGAVLVDPAGLGVWAVGSTPAFRLLQSVDGGLSFPGPELTPTGSQASSTWAIGGGNIVATGRTDEVMVLPIEIASGDRIVGGLPTAAFDQRAIAADPAGAVIIAQAEVSGGLTVQRLPSGAPQFDAGVFVDAIGESPSLTSVSGALVAVLYTAGEQVRVAIVDPASPP